MSPLGDHAGDALHVLALGSFAALGVVCFLLATELVAPAAGVLLAAIVLTREPLVTAMLDGSFDIVFLALVVLAVWLEARRSPPPAVAAALVAAGLLRPEAWLLLAAYAAYRVRCHGARARQWLAVALAAPAAWAAFDLAVTGDALHSLRGTRELADALERPAGAGSAPGLLAGHLVFVLGEPVAWGGAAAGIAAAWLSPARMRLPLAVLALGLAAFLVLGIAGLPLLTRYVVIPALMLALLFCAGVLGARHVRDARARALWTAGGVALAVALLAFAPGDVERLADTVAVADRRRAVQDDLEALVRSPAVRRCEALELPGHRAVPGLARLAGDDLAIVVATGAARGRGVATVVPLVPDASTETTLAGAAPVPLAPRPGAPVLAQTASVSAVGDCG